MARWECIVCGLIYDEKEGWPEDGIAPGTKWEDVPDDWTCPDCGVGKDDFELIPGSDDGEAPADDAAPAAADDAVARSIVVIGSGLAGYGLVRELRRKDDAVAITVLTADGGEGYSKPMISTGYTKDLNADKLAAQSAEELAEQLNVTVRTRTRVASIDTAAQVVNIEGGEALPCAIALSTNCRSAFNHQVTLSWRSVGIQLTTKASPCGITNSASPIKLIALDCRLSAD